MADLRLAASLEACRAVPFVNSYQMWCWSWSSKVSAGRLNAR